MIVVSDTSPLTNLFKIERLDLLHKLFEQIIIPQEVFQELSKLRDQQEIFASLDWIRIIPVKDHLLVDELAKMLDRGEAEAIALAVDLKANYLLIDEMKGRTIARKYNLTITGVLGILIRAKQKGLLEFVKPDMDKLIYEADFRVHPKLYKEVLGWVGE